MKCRKNPYLMCPAPLISSETSHRRLNVWWTEGRDFGRSLSEANKLRNGIPGFYRHTLKNTGVRSLSFSLNCPNLTKCFSHLILPFPEAETGMCSSTDTVCEGEREADSTNSSCALLGRHVGAVTSEQHAGLGWFLLWESCILASGCLPQSS